MIFALALAATLVDPSTYVGNVYGTITGRDGSPAANVLVIAGDRVGRTDAAGAFLINSLPTGQGRDYEVVIGDEHFNVHVLPGAAMAVEFHVQLGGAAEWHYRHENPNSEPRAPSRGATNYTHTVFSTREGLVGGTTANGHVIVPNDRFAALPSRRALSSREGHEREVRVTYRGRTTIVPVWDIGPWNIHDDYWNPNEIRETFKDLPRGKPEAEAAFLEHYNGGLDERGRVVKTPAGIDLADGTFWLDLGLTNNDWVEVEYLWLDSTGPVTTSLFALPNPAPPNTTIAIDATINDASPIAGAEFFIDSPGAPGTGTPAIAADASFDSTTETVTLPYSTVGWMTGSTHTIYVRARDVYGNWGELASANVTVTAPLPRRRAVRR